MNGALDDRLLDDRALLVRAVIAAPERAASAWRLLLERREGSTGVRAWVADRGESRLLPLLGDRADLLGLDDEMLSACRAATAEAWGLNERLLANLSPWISACTERGVTTVAMKGLALLGDVYPVHAHRSLGDADVLIPLHQLDASLDAMREVGWAVPRRPGTTFRAASHALTVALPGGGFLDLHWRPGAIAPCDIGPAEWTLQGARPVDGRHPLAATGLSRPSAERHLLIMAAHGGRVLNSRIAHWMVDLAAMLGVTPSLDADATVEAAAATPFALRAATGLRRTRDVVGVDLPIDPDRLRSGTSRLQRVELRTITSEQRSWGMPPRSWRARYQLVRRTAGWAPWPTVLVTIGLARLYLAGRTPRRAR